MKNEQTETFILSFRVDKDTKEVLERLAKQDRRTLSNYLRIVVEEFVKEKTK